MGRRSWMLAWVLAAAPAFASLPGLEAYEGGDYARAVPLLQQSAAEPKRPASERAQARLYLAATPSHQMGMVRDWGRTGPRSGHTPPVWCARLAGSGRIVLPVLPVLLPLFPVRAPLVASRDHRRVCKCPLCSAHVLVRLRKLLLARPELLALPPV